MISINILHRQKIDFASGEIDQQDKIVVLPTYRHSLLPNTQKNLKGPPLTSYFPFSRIHKEMKNETLVIKYENKLIVPKKSSLLNMQFFLSI